MRDSLGVATVTSLAMTRQRVRANKGWVGEQCRTSGVLQHLVADNNEKADD